MKLAKLTGAGWITLILIAAFIGMIPADAQAKLMIGDILEPTMISTEAQQQSQDVQTSEAEEQPSVKVPDLVDIIPLANELFNRLADLEKRVADLLDVAEVERSCAEIEVNLEGPVAELEQLKAEEHRGLNRLTRLRETIRQENKLLEDIDKPLKDSIRKLEAWRTEWLAEKKKWPVWQSSLYKEGEIDQLKLTFVKVEKTINMALDIILPRLNTMLASQEKISRTQVKINALVSEVDSLIEERQVSTLFAESPPMFTSQYFAQFGSDMRYALERGLTEIIWPDSRFFARQGWIIFIQICLALFISLTLYRKRRTIEKSERWRFLALRPFSAGLFFFSMTAMLIYSYEGAPPVWTLATTAIAVVSFARLSGFLSEASWKRHFVYGLMIVLIVLGFMDVLSFPLPLYRLFTVLTALLGFLFCLRLAGECRRL